MKQVNLMLEDNNIEVYINGDPTRNIVFNPTAIGFIDKYIKLIDFANNARNDDRYKIEEVSSDVLINSDGDVSELITSLKSGLDSYTLFFNDLSDKVDELFGKGAFCKSVKVSRKACWRYQKCEC